MGTRTRWAAALGAVVAVVGTLAWHPWSRGPSEHDAVARACDEQHVRHYAWPDAKDLRGSAEPTDIVLCRWKRVNISDDLSVSTTRLVGERRDRVMTALRHLRPHQPEEEPLEGFREYFTLELRVPGPNWHVQVPRNPRMGIPLNDGAGGAWHTTGGLPQVLDRWVGR